jgi:hypothetical protein
MSQAFITTHPPHAESAALPQVLPFIFRYRSSASPIPLPLCTDPTAHEVRNEVMEEVIQFRGVKAMESRRVNLQKRAETEGDSAKKAESGENWQGNQQQRP